MLSGGAVVGGPVHRHVVEMDFTRIQAQLDYRLTEPWGITFRLPYDIKDRSASIELIDPATALEQEQMQDLLDLHHTNEVLTGFGDASLLATWHAHDLAKEGDLFSLALGTSIPIGQTEHDPYEAGSAAEAHEHVQFGTGTFDPLLETYYTRSLESWNLSLFAIARLPVYESSKDYRGSRTTTLGLNAMRPIGGTYAASAALIYQREGFAHWAESGRDVNTGFSATSLKLGVSRSTAPGSRWSLGLILPIETDPLDPSGEAFVPGPLLELSLNF